MKKVISLMFIVFSAVSQVWSQGNPFNPMPLIGDNAPSFTAESTAGTIHFPGDYSGKWKIICSHPADFTPVCSTEILEMGQLQNEFSKLNTQLLVLSTQDLDSHKQWVKSLETVHYNNQPPVQINFPLIADNDHSISKKYGMLHPNTNSSKDVRGVFFIDPKNTIRAIMFYPLNVGRNFDEILRTLQALQTADADNVLTPANWTPGKDVMVQSTKYTSDQVDQAMKDNPDLYQLTWYMTYKKLR